MKKTMILLGGLILIILLSIGIAYCEETVDTAINGADVQDVAIEAPTETDGNPPHPNDVMDRTETNEYNGRPVETPPNVGENEPKE